MVKASDHITATLLQELRTRSARPPDDLKPADADPPQSGECGLAFELGRLRPLLLAAAKSHFLGSLAATCLGLLLLVQGVRRHLVVGHRDTMTLFLHGASIALIGCAALGKLPQLLPFLPVKTLAGFYCTLDGPLGYRNTKVKEALMSWFSFYRPTPFYRSGDICTVMPFLLNPGRGRDLTWERVWLESSDGEVYAMDWVFPPSGFNPSRPVVVLLPGLAPARHWTLSGGFVADATEHLTMRADMTVVVMVPRGTMDTAARKELFHGARTSDLRETLILVRDALDAVCKAADAGVAEPPSVFAAGYSMGAIILSNYCGQFAADTLLRGAVAFAGTYDPVLNMSFRYSREVWQAYLVFPLKKSFMRGRYAEEATRRGVDVPRGRSSAVSSILDFDREMVAPYNSYKSVEDYYSDMGLAWHGKWKQVQVPLLAVNARDDPFIHCDTLRAEEFAAANPNLLFLITDQGGHVGWPWGMCPWRQRWDFMNEIIVTFVDVVSITNGTEVIGTKLGESK